MLLMMMILLVKVMILLLMYEDLLIVGYLMILLKIVMILLETDEDLLVSCSLLNSFNRREIRSKYSLLSSASQNLWTNGRKSPKLITSKSGGKWGKSASSIGPHSSPSF